LILTNTNEIQGKLPSGNIGDATEATVSGINTQTSQLAFTGTYLNSQIKASDDIDFTATQSTSLTDALTSQTTTIQVYGDANWTTAETSGITVSGTAPTVVEIREEMESEGNMLDRVDTNVSGMVTDLTYLRQYETGRWKIVNRQMLFYDSDGTTVIATYNLLDENGNATDSLPSERVPA